jgi:hypothetical protein
MSDYPQADYDLIQRTWDVMQRHKGRDNRISRELLVVAVFGTISETYDRQLRDALAHLPIIWENGYFIPESHREAAGYRISMQSRQSAISQRLRVLDDYLRKLGDDVEQLSLLEEV